ncbi:MAG TPA: hypothetical protein VGR06_33995 [Actinophytocola sp.]|uniref:DUF7144 family membrane protein n=1 Tax=Actinophytocola sp. TaxID=1872138 RepID=UPI002E062206|nr:hypothetical protein [Actinophytocola sp.]
MSEYTHHRTGRVEDPADGNWQVEAAPARAGSRSSAWAGWIVFAGITMLMIGSFNAIEGLVALFDPNVYIAGPDNVLVFDLTTWGWVHLIIGVLVAITGIALLADAGWARPVTVVLAALNAIVQLTFVTVYPVWSLAAVTLCVVVIWAIVVHGSESRMDW